MFLLLAPTMIVVPLVGDKVETETNISFKVLSYTNYKSEGPAVIVESPDEKTTETIFFKDIVLLNDQKVKLIKNADGYNVFEIDGYIKRKFQLPQPKDIISSDTNGIEQRLYIVNRIRLHIKDRLSQGVVIDCQEQETEELVEITLDKIFDIEHTLFNRKGFQTYYSDYIGKA